jgi:HEAT repeat protein
MRWWRVRQLRKQLRSKGFYDRWEQRARESAATELGKLKDRGSIKVLVAAVTPDRHGLPQAAWALGQIGGRRAVDALLPLLKDNVSEPMRSAAAEALAEIGDPCTIEPVVGVLWKVPRCVPVVITKLGKALIPPLVADLSAGVPAQRRAAFEILQQLNWRPERDAERVACAIATENWESLRDQKTVSYLSARLADPGSSTRAQAAQLLKRLGYEPKEAEQAARFYAATFDWKRIRQLGKAAVGPLLELIDWNRVDQVELGNTLQALGWAPTDERQRLWLLITSQRFSEAADLGPIAIDSLAKVVELLKNRCENSCLVEVAQALGRFREKKAVDALESLAERTPCWEDDESIFSAAVGALSRIGGGLAAGAIWRLLQKCAHPRTVKALERILAEDPASIAGVDLGSIASTEWLTGECFQETGPIPYGDPDCTGIIVKRRVQVPNLSRLAKAELEHRKGARLVASLV